ncbi:MAG: NAD(P)H-dependent oxidoreductase subunit E [Bacillota bacterium]
MKEVMTKQQVQAIIEKYSRSEERLVQMLLDVQEASGQNYIPKDTAIILAEELNIPLTRVYDVITFYSMFNTEPKGRYIIEVCKSAPCHVNKPQNVISLFEKILGIKLNETTPDKMFTLQQSSCFGACDIAPAVKIGDSVYGNLDEEKITALINNLREVQN